MDKLKFKKEILRNAEWRIEQREADFSEEISRLQESSAYQPEEQDTLVKMSMDDDAKDDVTTLSMEQNFAHEQLLHLVSLERAGSLLDHVAAGAAVVTDAVTFFISVALEEFEIDGRKVKCISTEAPIYREMVGKRKGDHFSFKGRKYLIKDVF